MRLSYVDWASELAKIVMEYDDGVLKQAADLIGGSRLVVTAGNGGSSCLASHAAQALMKPFHHAGGGVAAVCVTDGVPTLTAHANDGGWKTALEEAALPFINLGATLMLFSSSGTSPNILRLAELAANRRQQGACHHHTIAFTGFEGTPLRSLATLSIHVDSHDYEVVEPAHDALLHRVQYHLRLRGAS